MLFILGFFIVGLFSSFVIGLCRAAHDGEENYDKEVQN